MRLADRRQATGDGAGLGHLGQLHQVQRHRLGAGGQRPEAPVVGPGAELGPVRAVGPQRGLGLGGVDVAPGLFGQLLETDQGERVGNSDKALLGAVLRLSDARYLPIIARQKAAVADPLRTSARRRPAPPLQTSRAAHSLQSGRQESPPPEARTPPPPSALVNQDLAWPRDP